MAFTDIFIKRPVLAAAINILIFILGFASLMSLEVSEYPKMVNTIITVTTNYPGASPSVVQGFISLPLEKSIASAEGIDYLTSTSQMGSSSISAYIVLNDDPDAALTEVTGKVNAVLNQLPKEAESPIIVKETGETFPSLIVSYNSKTLSREQISSYVGTVVEPTIFTAGGISNILVAGEKRYAMRIWLNTQKMALLDVTPSEVQQALANNSMQAAPGQLKANQKYINLSASTDLHSVDQFNNLIIKQEGDRLVRIKDIGHAELGSEDYNTEVKYGGVSSVFVNVQLSPNANALVTIAKVTKLLSGLQAGFPPGLNYSVVYNVTDYINSSIHDVIMTIFEAVAIVVIVIFLFLGSLRAVLIPIVSIPLSLVGVCLLMSAMGFTINLLTLLAMVLAIGLVVDDAIVVLENIHRHLEHGENPVEAAIKGAREVASPILVMATTLIAVFAPIGFMGGITGGLFKQFAFTLASCVLISAVVALTLSPMLCSKLISAKTLQKPMAKKIDSIFEKIRQGYLRCLSFILAHRFSVLSFGLVILILCGVFYTQIPQELAPQEDQGIIIVAGKAPSWANLGYLNQFEPQLDKTLASLPQNTLNYFELLGLGLSGIQPDQLTAGYILKPWDQRKATEMSLVPIVQKALNNIPGLVLIASELPSLPGNTPPPIQFIIKSTGDYTTLYSVAQKVVQQANQSGLFLIADSDLQFDMPNITMNIDREKAANLGISMSQISDALATMTGGNYVNFFSMQGYSFKVIPQVPDDLRRDTSALEQIHVRTAAGKLIPLSTLITFSTQNQPMALNHFDQLNSVTIVAAPKPDVTIGTCLNYLKSVATPLLPRGASLDYAQESRQYMQTGNTLVWAFFLAIVVIFLVLAMQFESFTDPLVILVSVPMATFGALLPLYFGAASMNIYTQIGLITLIGLISKHGILMVEFANKLQEHENLSRFEAIKKSAGIRLRPILMTALAMIFAVVPLLIATGAGAVSRYDVGLVIFSGLLIGTFFTLFVVPTMYTFLGRNHTHDLL